MDWLHRVLRWRIERRNRRTAIDAAMEAFLREHPGERSLRAHVKADELERYVVMILWLTDHIPPNYCFYEVEKGSHIAKALVDDSNYRPTVWR